MFVWNQRSLTGQSYPHFVLATNIKSEINTLMPGMSSCTVNTNVSAKESANWLSGINSFTNLLRRD